MSLCRSCVGGVGVVVEKSRRSVGRRIIARAVVVSSLLKISFFSHHPRIFESPIFIDKKLLVFLLKLSHNSNRIRPFCVLVPRRHKMNWSNKGDVLKRVKKNGFALQDASDELKNDKEIVLAAVNQNGIALRYASDELKKDKGIVMAAVNKNGDALQFASDELKKDKEIMSIRGE